MGIVFYFEIFFSCSLRTDGYCDYYDYHLMFFRCSWRIDVIIVDYLLVFSGHLYRTEVIL